MKQWTNSSGLNVAYSSLLSTGADPEFSFRGGGAQKIIIIMPARIIITSEKSEVHFRQGSRARALLKL